MFDIGFSEISVIAVVALVVLGPERLPKVARTTGQWIGKFQRYVSDVKADINREVDLSALKNMQQTVTQEVTNFQQQINTEVQQVQDAMPSLWGDDVISQVPFSPTYKKKLRSRRTAIPLWYKQQSGLRGHLQSGAARVKRHRRHHKYPS